MTGNCLNLIKQDNMATESTEERGKTKALPEVFSCSSVDSVDSVAIKKIIL
jgi:hypothetical protein